MNVAGRKASEFLPPALRPLARSLGREQQRARFAGWDVALRTMNVIGRGIHHMYGPESVSLCPRELVVLCLVRNGMAHLPTFLRHYRALGAKHIVLLDNDSTDDTVKLASATPDVTVYSTDLPYGHFETTLKRWLVHRFGSDGAWCLVADMDELFDYPFSRQMPLGAFLEYLNLHRYNAVTAQNLEMIPRQSIRDIQGRVDQYLDETHTFYDLSDLRQARNQFWLERNEFDSEGHFTHTGGIWETIFGYKGSKLTKQPLLRLDDHIKVFPYDPHFVADARIADVTAVFRHYKYTGRFIEHVGEELQRRQHYGGAEIFRHYQRVLSENPGLSLFRPTAQPWTAAEDLLPSGFLIASARYLAWAQRYASATQEGAGKAKGA